MNVTLKALGIVVSAVCLWASFSPGWGWLVWFALVPLFYALAGERLGKRFLLGALFGGIFFGLEFSFLGELRAIAGVWAWLAIGGMALLGALWGAVLGLLSTSGNPLYAAAIWTGLEILRSSGPWGVAFGTLPGAMVGQPFLPAAAFLGPWGLSLLVALSNASLARGIRDRRWLPLVLIGPTVLGALSLAWHPPRPITTVRIALVQPGLSLQKRLREPPEDQLEVYMDLLRGLDRPLDLVVLPEDALSTFLRLRPDLLSPLRDEVSRLKATIILGSWIREGDHYYNAALALGPGGDLRVIHRKLRLIPFGEYLPGRGILGTLGLGGFLEEAFPQDLTPGEGLSPWGPYGVLICSESQFPDLPRRLVSQGAGVLLFLTNDSWFGRSRLLWEHYAFLALRATETGRAALQAALTGITGGFAPGGEELGKIKGERGTTVLKVPLYPSRTPYDRTGDLPVWVTLGLVFLTSQWTRMRRLQLSERP